MDSKKMTCVHFDDSDQPGLIIYYIQYKYIRLFHYS